MRQNWLLIGSVVTVLAIPFALAAFEDSTREADSADPDDFDELVALAAIVESESEPEARFEPAEEQPLAEWERTEPAGISFLDAHLDLSKPRLRGEIADVYKSGDRAELTGRLLEFNRAHAEHQVSAEPYGHESALIVAFYFQQPEALVPILKRRWGVPDFVSSNGRVIAWIDRESGTRAVLRVNLVGELAVGPSIDLETAIERIFAKPPRSAAEANEVFPGQVESSVFGFTVYHPPVASGSDLETRIDYEVRDGVVANVACRLNLSLDPGGLTAIIDYLKRRYGSARRTERADRVSYGFKRGRGLELVWNELISDLSIAVPITHR